MFGHKWRQSDEMFCRFRQKIRVYGNRSHRYSFKATINWLIWNDVELVELQNYHPGFLKVWTFWHKSQILTFFSFWNFLSSKSIFLNKKTYNMLEGNRWWICVQISSRYLQNWLKHVKNRHFSRHFETLPWFPEFYFLTNFYASKSVLMLFFAFLVEIWSKNTYRSSKSRFFYLFYLVTWDDLDLCYGHKAQEMLLTNVSDTIHADSLALFALNIEILLAAVTKPEMSNILTLTWPVASLVTPEVIKICFPSTVFPGLSNAAWIFRIGPVLSEIRRGLENSPPPPVGARYKNTPVGRGLIGSSICGEANGLQSRFHRSHIGEFPAHAQCTVSQ